jgi:hypothetical protein
MHCDIRPRYIEWWNCKTVVYSVQRLTANVHDEERNGRKSVMRDYLVQSVDQKSVKAGASQFQNFRVKFHKFHEVLYQIITVRLGCHKFCARWFPKIITGEHKSQIMDWALAFLERYQQSTLSLRYMWSNYAVDRAIAQAVSRRLPTAARVRFQAK